MSSATSHAPPGDSKYGGTLFRLPREIRDKIYRLLVKGCYQTTKPCFSGNRTDVGKDDRPDLSILRVSKTVGSEAMEILYSESVFNLVMASDVFFGRLVDKNPDRLKRIAPMINHAILFFCGWSMANADSKLETSMIDMSNFFGGVIKRQSLRVRILACYRYLLEGTVLIRFCQRLKAFVGFRTVSVEVLSPQQMLRGPSYYELDDPEIDRDMCDVVSRLTLALAEQLEPAFGPAVSGFKPVASNVPFQSDFLSSHDEEISAIFLEFHPDEHLVERDVVEDSGMQQSG